jgi:aspartate 1-decarboxylase
LTTAAVAGAFRGKMAPAAPLIQITPSVYFLMRFVIRSKIHNATVTEANLAYIGSITIARDLMDRVGLWVGEKVLVVSNTSGARLETYTIEGARGSGTICMNGAAAHLIKTGEEIIIMGFELADQPINAKIILVDRDNRFVRNLES